MKTIEHYIQDKFKEANSTDFASLKSTERTLVRHGFSATANSKHVKFLEAFRSTPHLVEKYAAAYANCVFLNWDALLFTRRVLDLHLDLASNYTGAVPPEQAPWLDAFDMQPQDEVTASELLFELIEKQLDPRSPIKGYVEMVQHALMDLTLPSSDAKVRRFIAKLAPYHREARTQFFVLGPHESFNTVEDWWSRGERLVEHLKLVDQPPAADPLVLRFVRGGALVVAAWGDEAEWINRALEAPTGSSDD